MPEQLTVTKSEPLHIVASMPLSTEPPEGYWEHAAPATGPAERVPQSAIAKGSAEARRIASESGWSWHPPGAAPGQDATSQRADTAIVSGLPVIGDVTPEGLLMAYAGGRAVTGAMKAAVGTAQKVAAGLQATMGQVSPFVKYEVTKTVLRKMGVPAGVAELLAVGYVGYRGARTGAAAETPVPPPAPDAPHVDLSVPVQPGALTAEELAQRIRYGTGTPATTKGAGRITRSPGATYANPSGGPVAAPTSAPVSAPETAPAPTTTPLADLAAPGASPPAAPAPPAGPVAPQSAPISPAPSGSPWSPQRIANEVGLAARRSKLKLTDEQYAAAEDLVRQGRTPADAVRIAGPAPKVKVSAAEMTLYWTLRTRGLSEQAAREAVATQRELVARLGSPTTEQIRQAVEARNATGRWPDE